MRVESLQWHRRRSAPTATFILRAALLWLALVIVCAGSYIYSREILWSVVGPLAASALLTLGFLIYLWRIEGSIPYFEVGAFYAVALLLYCAYPLVQYIVNGYSYPEGADYRLIMMQDRPDALGTLSWWYVVYLVCFCVAYAIVRGRGRLPSPLNVPPPDAPTLGAIVFLLLATWLFFVVLGWAFDMSSSSYFEEYLVLQRLPHVVRQIAAHLHVIQITLQMMLVIALCCARRRQHHIILIAILLFTTASNVFWPRARIELFSVLLAAFAAYHLTVRRIPFRWVVIGALSGFFGLLAMGPARVPGLHTVQQIKSQMAVQTEFTAIGKLCS